MRLKVPTVESSGNKKALAKRQGFFYSLPVESETDGIAHVAELKVLLRFLTQIGVLG